MEPNPTFTSLPQEIHLQISTDLPLLSLPLLRRANYYFYNLLPPLSHTQLLAIETYPFARERCLFTCAHHLKLLPYQNFTLAQTTKSRQRGGREAKKRFCIDCGLKYRLYSWGAWIRIPGESEGMVLCLDCKVWEYKRGFETNRWEKTLCWDCGNKADVEEIELKVRDLGMEKEVRISREEMRRKRDRGEVYEFGVRDDGTDETLGGMLGILERGGRNVTL